MRRVARGRGTCGETNGEWEGVTGWGVRSPPLNLVGAEGEGAAGIAGSASTAADRAWRAGRAGFLALGEIGALWLGLARGTVLDFFAGAGAGEGVVGRSVATLGRAGRRGGVGGRGAGVGIAVAGGAVGVGWTFSEGETDFVRRAFRPFGGDDSWEGPTGSGGAIGLGNGTLLTAEPWGLWTGAVDPAGAVPEAGAGGGGVGTGSFFPVRGERDLGGMSRTLGDADYRVGFRSGESLDWLSQAAQTVFPKVLICRIEWARGLEPRVTSLSLAV